MSTPSQRTNQPSQLLSRDENNQVFSQIGPTSTVSVVGVSQLFMTEVPSHNKWHYKGSGAVCFVRDASRKSYFVRFISLDGGDISIEQELYKTIILHKSSNQFLAFEAHTCLWGLLFCEKSEFHQFENEMLSKVRPKNVTKVEKKASFEMNKTAKKHRKPSKSLNDYPPVEKEKDKDKMKKKKPEKSKKKEKSDKKPRLEISEPSNFVVLTHFGHDGITGIENMPDSDKWQDLIKFIYGSTAAEISQAETSHLLDLVAKNGGIEKYWNAVEKQKKKIKPSVAAPAKVAPPRKIPGREPVAAGPLPPPPPPPPSAPPPPSGVTPPPAGSSVRGSIPPATSLQEQIAQGKALKKVEVTENSSDEDEEGLLGALVNNLAAFRSKVKESSSEGESDESGEESDDW